MRERGTVWERQELNERERNCVGETRTAREKNKQQLKGGILIKETGQSLFWRDRNGVHGRTCIRVTGTIWKVQYLWGRDRNCVEGTRTLGEEQEQCGRNRNYVGGTGTVWEGKALWGRDRSHRNCA